MTLAAALLGGCASEKSKEAALARMGDESPPDFLTGPVSAALAGFDGFSANVVSTTTGNSILFATTAASADAGPQAVSGQLIGRRGQIIFQPLTTANARNGKIVRGGMLFIWDAGRQSGFVVSEALQGFAPIAASSQITNIMPATPPPPASEAVKGHRCRRIESVSSLSDGSSVKLTEWRADDLNRFPVRMRAESGGRRMTVDLSEIRLDIPAPELFVPPVSFTQYASGAALINELMIRESSLKKGPAGASTQTEQTPNYHPPGQGFQQ
jgi:hypothetical protein